MTKISTKTVIALGAVLLLASCANTIRGAGQDTANAVNAAQHAGKKIDRAAKY